jgi:hypothetical protein
VPRSPISHAEHTVRTQQPGSVAEPGWAVQDFDPGRSECCLCQFFLSLRLNEPRLRNATRVMIIYYFGLMRCRILLFAAITVTVGDLIHASEISSATKAKFDEVG